MRLNRATAAARDQARESSGRKAADDQACENIWAELVGAYTIPSPRKCLAKRARTANWKRRTTLIGYCVSVVDESIDSKRSQISEKQADPTAQRRIKGEMYSDEVLVCGRPSSISHPAHLVYSATKCTTSSRWKRSFANGHWMVRK